MTTRFTAARPLDADPDSPAAEQPAVATGSTVQQTRFAAAHRIYLAGKDRKSGTKGSEA